MGVLCYRKQGADGSRRWQPARQRGSQDNTLAEKSHVIAYFLGLNIQEEELQEKKEQFAANTDGKEAG